MLRLTPASTRSHRSLTVALLSLGLATGIGLGGFPLQAIAQEYVPPLRGVPGRREGGGTRGGCPSTQPSLTALMPDSNFGTTLSAYPSFLWYVPGLESQQAEFVLLDENDEVVYETAFQMTSSAGIVSLSLPATANIPPLQVGKDYHWYFSLICDPLDRSGDLYTEGWIQRIEADADLMARLEAAPVGDRPTIYAESGIWYDAVASLATLRRTQPGNSGFAMGWQTLLRSVDLGSLDNQPLVACCDEPAAAADPPEQSIISPEDAVAPD